MLQNPAVRWGIGVSGGVVIAAISFLFLSGTVQLVAYGIALLDVILTPQILKQAVDPQ